MELWNIKKDKYKHIKEFSMCGGGRFNYLHFQNIMVMDSFLLRLFCSIVTVYLCYIEPVNLSMSKNSREGLNKDINKMGGIFHRGLIFCHHLLLIWQKYNSSYYSIPTPNTNNLFLFLGNMLDIPSVPKEPYARVRGTKRCGRWSGWAITFPPGYWGREWVEGGFFYMEH